MGNHFHLVVETPNANLVAGMRWLLSTYTIRLNHRHKLFGHVFSGRYKAQLIDPSPGYLRTACDYTHLNPVRARLLKNEEPLLAYPWSSFGFYLASPRHRPQWIRTDRLLGEHGLDPGLPNSRQEFAERMEARRREEENEDRMGIQALRRGWFLGGAGFKKELVGRMEGKLTEDHAAELRRETAEARADRILAEELKRLGWTKAELARRRKNDRDKLAVGARLRKETTLTIKEIARRVSLGTAKGASSNLHKWMK